MFPAGNFKPVTFEGDPTDLVSAEFQANHQKVVGTFSRADVDPEKGLISVELVSDNGETCTVRPRYTPHLWGLCERPPETVEVSKGELISQ
jgi:hypothetical protein